MPKLDPKNREVQFSVVYYGPGYSGKTQNLVTANKILPDTSKKKPLRTLATNNERTLFFDFMDAQIPLADEWKAVFMLRTVPGQPMYVATRQMVLAGVDGIVFVADSLKNRTEANYDSIEDLRFNLMQTRERWQLAKIPLVMQYNKRDLASSEIHSVAEMHAMFNGATVDRFEEDAPWVEAVATTGVGVMETLNKIVELVVTPYMKPGTAAAAPAATAS